MTHEKLPLEDASTQREASQELLNNRMPAYQNGLPPTRSTFNINQSYEGEPIETRVAKILNNNEPITDGAPTIYTERKDGVIPEYNIRTDRFDEALTMTDVMTQRELQKRAERHAGPEPTGDKPTGDKPTGDKPTGDKPTA